MVKKVNIRSLNLSLYLDLDLDFGSLLDTTQHLLQSCSIETDHHLVAGSDDRNAPGP
jgi:hypothetical protein